MVRKKLSVGVRVVFGVALGSTLAYGAQLESTQEQEKSVSKLCQAVQKADINGKWAGDVDVVMDLIKDSSLSHLQQGCVSLYDGKWYPYLHWVINFEVFEKYEDAEQAARTLLKKGVDINKPEQKEGMTPLHWAANRGCIGMVMFLLEQDGIQINKRDAWGLQAVDMARVASLQHKKSKKRELFMEIVETIKAHTSEKTP